MPCMLVSASHWLALGMSSAKGFLSGAYGNMTYRNTVKKQSRRT